MARTGVNVFLIDHLSTLVDGDVVILHSCAIRLCNNKYVVDMNRHWTSYLYKPYETSYELYYAEFMGDVYHGIKFALIIGDSTYILHVRGRPVVKLIDDSLVIRANFKLKVSYGHDPCKFHLRIDDYSYKICHMIPFLNQNTVCLDVKRYPLTKDLQIPAVMYDQFEPKSVYELAHRVLKLCDYFQSDEYKL